MTVTERSDVPAQFACVDVQDNGVYVMEGGIVAYESNDDDSIFEYPFITIAVIESDVKPRLLDSGKTHF